MGFSVEYPGLVITHVLYKAALVLAMMRWVLCCGFRYLGLGYGLSLGLPESIDREIHQQTMAGPSSSSSSPSSSSSSLSAQMIRDSLHVSTYRDISGKSPEGGGSTCAVCLNELRGRDKVWELRNCCHVFHKRCLDRWLDHDEHKTCPLCRAPLMGLQPGPDHERTEPSWAVERLLYLFGDDLIFASSS